MKNTIHKNMSINIIQLQISGMFCDLFLPESYHKGTDRYPVIYVNGEIPISKVLAEAANLGVETEFILLAVHPENWNDDFTPWSAPAFRKGEDAPQGKAEDYIVRLSQQIKPYMDNAYRTKPEPEHTALLGYSLGGLTAVYSLYMTDQFGIVGSLSGSLWYDGFCKFMEGTKPLRTDVKIYLSLGKKESLSKNPRMRLVAECTEKAKNILTGQIRESCTNNRCSEAKNVPNVYFEWNDGGHFHEIEKRFAKAILWWERQIS